MVYGRWGDCTHAVECWSTADGATVLMLLSAQPVTWKDCSIPPPIHPITAPDHHGVSNTMLSREADVFYFLQPRHFPAVEVEDCGVSGSRYLASLQG